MVLSRYFTLFVCFVFALVRGQNSLNISRLLSTPKDCRFAPGLVVGNETATMECCNRTMTYFHVFWTAGQLYLTTYLQTLQSWECPQFVDECQNRRFVVNSFTELVFDYFCNYTDVFVPGCYDIVAGVQNPARKREELPLFADGASGMENETLLDDWRSLIRNLKTSTLTTKEITSSPCLQVALYETEENNLGEFVELIRVNIPPCYPTWCGINGASIRDRVVSVWDCLSQDCRISVITIMVVCGLLAVIVTLVNLTVVMAYIFNPNLLHSQGVYKVSLAVADILTGLIIFPSFISNLSRISQGTVSLGAPLNVTGYEQINDTITNETSVVQILPTAGHFEDYFNQSYLDAIGFFTIVSLTSSVYCLTIAGFDRLTAVYRPLSYRKDKAKKLAKWLCGVIWSLAIFFGILPTFVPSLKYGLVGSVLVSSGGQGALILYVIAFLVPLILMWIVNAVTYHSTRKHARVRRHITIDTKKKTDSIEVRLARTLSIMVGVFTLSLLPAAVVILASLFTPAVYLSNPSGFNLENVVVYNTFEFATIIILVCNSLWNFFIYNARNFEFRKAVRIMYQKVSEKTGLSACFTHFLSCAQSVVHDSRRRLSSLPNISTSLGGKKTSLFPTSTTNITSRSRSVDVLTSDAIYQAKSSQATLSALEQSSDVSAVSETGIKIGKKRVTKADTTVTDDSIFQSFAIEAHADHLFESVMEKVDEEIEEVGKESETKQ